MHIADKNFADLAFLNNFATWHCTLPLRNRASLCDGA